MTLTESKTIKSKLISEKDLEKEYKLRKKPDIEESILKANKILLNERMQEGWIINREYKTLTKISKRKNPKVLFEDKVWVLLANMGFTFLNKNRSIGVPYDKKNLNLTKDFTIVGKDSETLLLVDCRISSANQYSNFSKDLELTKEQIGGINGYLRSLYKGEKIKLKYILVTSGYKLSEVDKNLLDNINGIHIDEEAIDYYSELYNQIGNASKYQFLANIFNNLEIPEMDNLVPAVRGEMGGLDYYSFSIEPEKLLKIGYVLHRSKANEDMIPTYQRLIKKNRLKQIHDFIDNQNGYFPNSIVISIDTEGKGLIFDKANTQSKTSVSSVGMLHLPKKYRSAFIIDGQHRLYGYANSKYKSTNSIPVVAFVDLKRQDQVKLFMEINENQKSVSKNLRVTLNSDLLWTSEDKKEQMKALTSRIAITLGEDLISPLLGYVSIGEDKKIISTESIAKALRLGNFLGIITKNELEKSGTFYKGDLDIAFERLSNYIITSLEYIKKALPELWNNEMNILMMNRGIYSIIRILSDITDHLIKKGIISNDFSNNELNKETEFFLNAIINFYKNIDSEKINELQKAYGGGGEIKYWRTLQNQLSKEVADFKPDGLDDYLQAEKREYNEEAFGLIRDIEGFLKRDFKEKLINAFGEKDELWFIEGVPGSVQDDAMRLAQEKKREKKGHVDYWDCLHLIDYHKIALNNWKDIFEKDYSLQDPESTSRKKENKTSWLIKLNKLRNQNFHSYTVSKDEIEFIRKIHNWLILK